MRLALLSHGNALLQCDALLKGTCPAIRSATRAAEVSWTPSEGCRTVDCCTVNNREPPPFSVEARHDSGVMLCVERLVRKFLWCYWGLCVCGSMYVPQRKPTSSLRFCSAAGPLFWEKAHIQPRMRSVVIFFSLTEARPSPRPHPTPRNGPETDPKWTQTEPKRTKTDPKWTKIKLSKVGRPGGLSGWGGWGCNL